MFFYCNTHNGIPGTKIFLIATVSLSHSLQQYSWNSLYSWTNFCLPRWTKSSRSMIVSACACRPASLHVLMDQLLLIALIVWLCSSFWLSNGVFPFLNYWFSWNLEKLHVFRLLLLPTLFPRNLKLFRGILCVIENKLLNGLCQQWAEWSKKPHFLRKLDCCLHHKRIK